MQGSTIFNRMSPILVVMAIQTLISLGRISPHLIRPFKVWLPFYFLKDLIHWLFKHRVDQLCISPRWLIGEISLGSIMTISSYPRISLFREDFGLSFPLGLIFFNLLMLDNAVHNLTHIVSKFHCLWFPQVMLRWEPNLKGPYSYILELTICLIKCFPIPIRIGL